MYRPRPHPSKMSGNVGFFGIVLGIIGFAIFPLFGVLTFIIGGCIDEYISYIECKPKIDKFNKEFKSWNDDDYNIK